MGLKKEREKQLAMELYMGSDALAKEIAQKVGVSAQTMSRWIKEGSWDTLKAVRTTSPTEAIRNAMELYVLTSRDLLEKKRNGEDVGSIGDELSKITGSIKVFNNSTPLEAYVYVLDEFMDFVPKKDIKFKQRLAEYHEKFLRKKFRIE